MFCIVHRVSCAGVLLQNHQASVKDPRSARGVSPNPQRAINSPARTRSGSSNLANMQTAPSSSSLQRQPSSSGLYRQPSSTALQKQLSSSLVALLRQGSGTSPALQRGTSPALQRRSGEQGTSPALQRPATSSSSALQRPATASSSATQRQGSSAGLDRLLSQGGLAALLRQASSNSPIRSRPEHALAVPQQRQSHSPAVQRPEVTMQRQEVNNKGKAPMRGSSPDLHRAASSRQGSAARAVRGSSPAQRQQGGFPAPVVAADFARRGSSGVLTNAPSGELVSRSERVRFTSSMQ